MDIKYNLQPSMPKDIERHQSFKTVVGTLQIEYQKFNFEPLKHIYYNTGKTTPKLAIAIINMAEAISGIENPDLRGLVDLEGDLMEQVYRMSKDDKILLYKHLDEKQAELFRGTFGKPIT